MIEDNKSISKEIANRLNFNQEEVFRALDFVYRDAKAQLENFKDIEIYMFGLGSFVARRKKIHHLIKYFQVRKEKLSELNNTKLDTETLIADCDKKIEQLKLLNDLYKIRDEKRKQLKNEQTVGNISEPETDLGRTEE